MKKNEANSIEMPTIDKRELRSKLFFSPLNRIQDDGRINAGVDENGLLLAHSIHPDFDGFRTQIEDGIWPLVSALKEKEYPTIDSCEGHPLRARVKIGFGTKLCRDKFMNSLQSLDSKYIDLVPHNHCVNMESNVDFESGKISTKRMQSTDNIELNKLNTDSFNFQFDKNFPQWFFLDLYILPEEVGLSHVEIMETKSKIISKISKHICSQEFPAFNISLRKSKREMSKNRTPFKNN